MCRGRAGWKWKDENGTWRAARGFLPCIVGERHAAPGCALPTRTVCRENGKRQSMGCSGGHCAAVGGFAALRMRRPLYGERAPCEGPFNRARALVHRSTTLTWQSREGSCVFAGSALLSGRVLRDCTPRALPRASRSGRHVGLWPPRNDKSGAFAILTAVCTGCRCVAGPGCPLAYNAQTAALHNSGFSSKCI